MSTLNHGFRQAMLAVAMLACGSASATGLELPAEGWARWSVPMQAVSATVCCSALDGEYSDGQRGCTLDSDGGGLMFSRSAPGSADTQLWVYVKQHRGKPVALRSVGESCPVEGAATVATLASATPAASLAFLEGVLADGGKRLADDALTAIALHAEARATEVLAAASAPAQPRKQREQALFWLGELRGEAGLPSVLRAVEDRSPAIRGHALFVLSQSPLPQARSVLRERVQADPAPEVRGQALFWLAQVDDETALEAGLALLADPRHSEVHDEAVFALSQLPKGKGDEAMIAIITGDFPRPAKKQALFWLGQSGSDAALRFIDTMLAARP